MACAGGIQFFREERNDIVTRETKKKSEMVANKSRSIDSIECFDFRYNAFGVLGECYFSALIVISWGILHITLRYRRSVIFPTSIAWIEQMYWAHRRMIY